MSPSSNTVKEWFKKRTRKRDQAPAVKTAVDALPQILAVASVALDVAEGFVHAFPPAQAVLKVAKKGVDRVKVYIYSILLEYRAQRRRCHTSRKLVFV